MPLSQFSGCHSWESRNTASRGPGPCAHGCPPNPKSRPGGVPAWGAAQSGEHPASLAVPPGHMPHRTAPSPGSLTPSSSPSPSLPRPCAQSVPAAHHVPSVSAVQSVASVQRTSSAELSLVPLGLGPHDLPQGSVWGTQELAQQTPRCCPASALPMQLQGMLFPEPRGEASSLSCGPWARAGFCRGTRCELV